MKRFLLGSQQIQVSKVGSFDKNKYKATCVGDCISWVDFSLKILHGKIVSRMPEL